MRRIAKSFWHLLKIIACVLLIVNTFYCGFSFFNETMRTEGVEYNDSFHNLPADSMDVIVLGSSHAQYSFMPQIVYQNTGLYSYVLGSACQPLKVSYEMLKEALKTQSPELVILEIYTATPLKSWCEGDSCYVMAEYQMRGEEKQNVIDFLPEEKAMQYKNEFLINHNNWKTANRIEDILKKPDYSYIDPCLGYVCLESVLPVDNWWFPNTYKDIPDVELDDADVKALNNIYDLCKKKNIQLLLYMMPMDGIDELNQSYRYEVWKWATEKNVSYIDFVDKAEELNYRMCVHNDGAHSKLNGANLITDYISEYIVNNYNFLSHESSKKLDDIYSKYIPEYTIKILNSEYNPRKYLSRILKYDKTIILSYAGGTVTGNKELEMMINAFDLEDFDSNDPYFAIIQNKHVIECGKSELNAVLKENNITVNRDKIIINDDAILCDGDISIVVLDNDFDKRAVKKIKLSHIPWDVDHSLDYTW